MSETAVTFGDILIALKQRGQVAQAERMLQDVADMVEKTARTFGMGTLIPSKADIMKELLQTPKDDVITLVSLFQSNQKPIVKPVQQEFVRRRVKELKSRGGWYVTVGGSF